MMLKYKILGCRIVDGTGNPWFVGDIGIKDGKIVAIGDLSNEDAEITLNVQEIKHDDRNPSRSLVVAPGFIDIHTHADYTILAGSLAESFIRQGVTTLVMGNCGFSLAPVNDKNIEWVVKHLQHKEIVQKKEINWSNFGEFFQVLKKQGLLYNILTYCGHNTLRTAVLGLVSRQPTQDEIRTMQELLEEALDAGAVGLSAGLEFPPGRNADEKELATLCYICGKYGRLYAPHIRNRDQFYLESVKEALDIARHTGVPLQIAHLNCRANTGAPFRAWERVIAMIEEVRELEGIDIATDCIPYAWGPGSYTGILPDWFTTLLASDMQKAVESLKDPAFRYKLFVESDRYWRFIYRGEWERVKLASSKKHPELIGFDFVEIGERLGKAPWEAYLQILCDEGEDFWGLQLYGKLFSEEHVVNLVKHPLFCLSSDAAPVSDKGYLANLVNPAAYGWVGRVLGYYVREQGALRLEEAVRKMTSFPAERLKLYKRGIIREGFWADLVIFDPVEINDITTSEILAGYVKGIYYVFVNGELVFANGQLTGQLPGTIIVPGKF